MIKHIHGTRFGLYSFTLDCKYVKAKMHDQNCEKEVAIDNLLSKKDD